MKKDGMEMSGNWRKAVSEIKGMGKPGKAKGAGGGWARRKGRREKAQRKLAWEPLGRKSEG